MRNGVSRSISKRSSWSRSSLAASGRLTILRSPRSPLRQIVTGCRRGRVRCKSALSCPARSGRSEATLPITRARSPARSSTIVSCWFSRSTTWRRSRRGTRRSGRGTRPASSASHQPRNAARSFRARPIMLDMIFGYRSLRFRFQFRSARLALHATGVGGDEGPHDAQIRREIEAQRRKVLENRHDSPGTAQCTPRLGQALGKKIKRRPRRSRTRAISEREAYTPSSLFQNDGY